MNVDGKIAQLDQQASLLSTSQLRLQWYGVAAEGLYAAGWSDYPGFRPLEFAITRTGLVVFRGATYKAAGSTSLELMFSLPEGFRPREFITGSVVPYDVGANFAYARYVWVGSDGSIYAGSVDFFANPAYFDGMRFSVGA